MRWAVFAEMPAPWRSSTRAAISAVLSGSRWWWTSRGLLSATSLRNPPKEPGRCGLRTPKAKRVLRPVILGSRYRSTRCDSPSTHWASSTTITRSGDLPPPTMRRTHSRATAIVSVEASGAKNQSVITPLAMKRSMKL